MDLRQIIKEGERIKETIKREYVDPMGKSEPIYDGIANPELYLQSKQRILWILKEPYDNGEKLGDAEDGDWSIAEAMNNEPDKLSRWKVFRPICYINYGIWTGDDDWNYMPELNDCEEIRNGIKKIAYINISKLPALKTTLVGRIVEAYQKHRGLILDQIRTYAPNIIFTCNPHVNLILKDLGFPEPQWMQFGTAASIKISTEQRLVRVNHPSQRSLKRADYVNDAIKAANAD
ncbi:MAG: hypothetical protein WCH99_21365 [Verrucomicrobiota bacterium]